MAESSFSLVVVGTGFASTSFLHRYLARAPATSRILVLERGRNLPLSWQLKNRATSDLPLKNLFEVQGKKRWISNVAFGGGSNCWTGQTPRFMPADFQMKTRYGIGVDWPLS